MKIRIKNMVCRHCVAKVAEVASAIPGLNLQGVELGAITVGNFPAEDDLTLLDERLRPEGFEVIHSRDEETVADIKARLIELSRNSEGVRADISALLSDALHMSYRTLSRTFAAIEGRTIENYFTALRIERSKELLLDDQLPLSEIAFVTGFSSVPH
ncbi:MAG: helix-turn-helix domain-containing protein, partial [Duncaniella sp.]|nr:helix-turn-helix domain-containing protein [Duncaniella sp.]